MFTILAHGSSNTKHAEQVKALATEVSKHLGQEVNAAFLSDAKLNTNTNILPLFLSEGSHLKEDVPAMATPANATLLPSLADVSETIAALLVNQLNHSAKRVHVIFVLYQFRGFEKLLSSLYKQSKKCSFVAMASLHGTPNIGAVLKAAEKQGVKKVLIQPVLLFGGHSLESCKAIATQTNTDIEITFMPPIVGTKGFTQLITSTFQEHVSS